MSFTWLVENRRVWRIAILVLLLVAFIGPWTFDRINVPSEYTCSAPFIRLEGDFCGMPLSWIWFFPWIIGGIIYSSAGLITGELVFSEWIREFRASLLFILPLLPLLSTLLLIFRGEHRYRQVFTIFAWVLAIGIGLFWGLNNYPKLFWRVWGIWFYLGLAASALILEILVLISRKNLYQIR